MMTYLEFLDKLPMTRFHRLLVIGVSLAQLLDGADFISLAYAPPVIIKGVKLNPTQERCDNYAIGESEEN